MKHYILIALLVLLYREAAGQGGPAVWRFGRAAGISFTPSGVFSSAPAASLLIGTQNGCASIADKNGDLLFSANEYLVFDRNDERMPVFTGNSANYYNSMINYTGGNAIQSSLIVPFPKDVNRYYVFSLSSSGQLFYSIVDMSLHNGLGDLLPGKKGITVGSGLAEKMTAVKGCNNIWVVVRSMSKNRFLSYSITDTGLNLQPVISENGSLPVDKYRCGVIKFSPDGRKMASASYNYHYGAGLPYPLYGGLELYDFDPFSGKLSNPVVLDSSGVWYGACFSGNGSKLYTSDMTEKTVFQWDLSSPFIPSILASKTPVLTNDHYFVPGPSGWRKAAPVLGDLQRGPDGKIYIGNNVDMEYIQDPQGGFSPLAKFLHVIHQPDQPGALCQPQINAVDLQNRLSRLGLPNDIVYNPVQDTIIRSYHIAACFRDSIYIVADSGKEYVWNHGPVSRGIMVKEPGLYFVRYTGTDCALHVDSFWVRFYRMPAGGPDSYSCPSERSGKLSVKPPGGDSTIYIYVWKDADGRELRRRASLQGDSLSGLDTGRFTVQILSESGCDSFLSFYVHPLPVPEIRFESQAVVCAYDTVSFLNQSSGVVSGWSFGEGSVSGDRNPVHVYSRPGSYTVSLKETNVEGCSAEMSREIAVRDFKIYLYASEPLVRKHAMVLLTTDASEAYEVLSWQPLGLFGDHRAKQQYFSAQDSRTYQVKGRSLYGCTDSASVEVRVRPVIFMPTAFSPNGDGINDLFHPVVSGEPVRVRYFQVFDRWGKQLWQTGSNDPADGWDGTYGGRAADVGVYYYLINIETATGETFEQKGDVNLLR